LTFAPVSIGHVALKARKQIHT